MKIFQPSGFLWAWCLFSSLVPKGRSQDCWQSHIVHCLDPCTTDGIPVKYQYALIITPAYIHTGFKSDITKKSVCRFLPLEYVRLCSWGSLPFPCLPKCVDGSFPTCWNTYQWPEIDLEYYFISAWNFPWLDFCPYFGIVDKEYQYKMKYHAKFWPSICLQVGQQVSVDW